MIQQLIDNELFWIVLTASLLVYYGGVGYLFFKDSIRSFFSSSGQLKPKRASNITYDELAFSLSIQRKLLQDRNATLESHEQELMQQSPFKELLSNGLH